MMEKKRGKGGSDVSEEEKEAMDYR